MDKKELEKLQQAGMVTRSFINKPVSVDSENKEIRFTATTEQPATVWDWDRFDVISEVLLADGMVLPENNQVPLLDSHQRYTVKNILGSASDFGIGEKGGYNSVECVTSFAKDEDSQTAFEKVKDGHLTDMSVGYVVKEAVWIPENERGIVKGKEYEGPVKVATSWHLREVSLTPIGADSLAKARSFFIVNENNDTENNQLPLTTQTKSEDLKMDLTEKSVDLDVLRAEAVEVERARCVQIREKAKMVGLEDMADGLIAKGATIAEATDALFAEVAKRKEPVGQSIEVTADEADKFRGAVTDGLLIRAGVTVDKPAAGAEDFRGYELASIVRECMSRSGADVRRLNSRRAVADAMFSRALSTSDFPAIFGNAINKALQKAYNETQATFKAWTSKTSASDFKEVFGVSLSEAPSLDLVAEHEEYKSGSLKENQEKYSMFKYGKLIPLSWEMVINDDLKAFGRIPRLMGTAAKRKESDLVYALLTSNVKMADGTDLFHADHDNLEATTKGVIAGATLEAGRQAMRAQKGLNGNSIDIMPKFLLVSPAYETAAEVLLRSRGSLDDDKNGGVINPYFNSLMPISENRLSGKAWYLIADPSSIDTVEVAYLDGNETPQVTENVEFERDAMTWKVRHVFGCGVMDYRAFYKNAGE